MKLAIALALSCCSCVTAGDLRKLSDRVEGDFALELTALADELDERTHTTIRGLSQAGEGGLIGLIGAAGVYALRSYTRRRDIAVAKIGDDHAGQV